MNQQVIWFDILLTHPITCLQQHTNSSDFCLQKGCFYPEYSIPKYQSTLPMYHKLQKQIDKSELIFISLILNLKMKQLNTVSH